MSQISLEELADDLKNIYQLDPLGSETMIEKYLEGRLKGLSPDERLPLMEKLGRVLAESKTPGSISSRHHGAPDFSGYESQELAKLFSLLLGKEVTRQDFSSTEFQAELGSSLNTVYDTLNQILDIIDTNLLGWRKDIEPINQMIGPVFDKTEQATSSLKGYLDRIKDAFLIAQQGYRQAVHSRLGEILFELSPERMEAATNKGLKFGPLRKAELFEVYKEKYQICQRWFEAGHLAEEFLREFEKTCQKIYSEKETQKKVDEQS